MFPLRFETEDITVLFTHYYTTSGMSIKRWKLGLILMAFLPLTVPAQRKGIRQEIKLQRQVKKRYLPLSVTALGGATQFWGELNQQNSNRVYGGGLRFNLKESEAISFGVDVQKGRLSGQKRPFFNSRFVNHFTSIEFIPRWDVVRGITWNQENKFSLHCFAGIGLAIFSAEAFDLTSNERVRFTNDPEKSGRTPLLKKYGTPVRKTGILKTHERIVPIGIAPGYRLTNAITVGVDLRFYFARTDKLDATSGYRLINPEEADSYSSTPNDIYSASTFFVNYRLLKKR